VQPLRGSANVWRKLVPCWLLALIFALPQLFIFVQVEEIIEILPAIVGRVTIEGDDDETILSAAAAEPDGHSEAVAAVSGSRRVFACKSHGYTEEWQRKMYLTFMTLYILVIPAIIMTVCYTGIIRVVWLRTTSASREDWAFGSGVVGTSAAPRGDRPKIHFVSSKKAPDLMATERQYAASHQPQYGGNTASQRCVGAMERQRPGQAGSIQMGSAASATMRTSATARLQAAVSSKRNVVKMTMSVIVGFVVCWTPYFVVSLIRVYTNYAVRIDNALSVSELMTMGHSALNPLLYMLFSRRALATYCSLLRRRFCRCCSWFTCPPSSTCLRCCGNRPANRGAKIVGDRRLAVVSAGVKVIVGGAEAIDDDDQANDRSARAAAALRPERSSSRARAARRGDVGGPTFVRLVHDRGYHTARYSREAGECSDRHGRAASANAVADQSRSRRGADWRGVTAERTTERHSMPSSCGGCVGARPYSAPCFYRCGSSSPSNAAGLVATTNFSAAASISAVCNAGLASTVTVYGGVCGAACNTLMSSSSGSGRARRMIAESPHTTATLTAQQLTVATRYS